MLARLLKWRLIFWLIQFVCLAILWRYLPNARAGWLLMALAAFNGLLLLSRLFNLPVLTNAALILALTHFWMGNGRITPLIASVIIFFGLLLTGLIAESFNLRQALRDQDEAGLQDYLGLVKRENVRAWALISFFTAEVSSLVQLWPISYWQKAALCSVFFYLVWQTWRVIGSSRKTMLAHFVFVGAAVMVVVVNIIWTTWPGLRTF